MPPGQPSLVQCVFTMYQTMEQRLLHHVPTELAIDQSTLTLLSEVSKGGQHVYATIHSKFQDTTRKVPHVGLPCDAFILSLQKSEEVFLHSILADASTPCLVLLLLKNSPNFSPDGQHLFRTVSACVGRGSTCGVCGPGSTIGCGFSGRSRSS
jgi:hypothetical protein